MTYFDKNTVKLSHEHMKAHLNKGDTGFEEKDTMLEYLESLDQKKYTVIGQYTFLCA